MREMELGDLEMLSLLTNDPRWGVLSKLISGMRDLSISEWASGGSSEYHRGGYNAFSSILGIPDDAKAELEGRRKLR